MKRLQTNIVPPDGPIDAAILGIGQSPGRMENDSLIPFVGAAGQLLNRCLRQKGMARSSILIHNVFRQRPPNNRVEYFFQDKGKTRLTWEGEEHVESLRSWLEKLLRRREAGLGGPNVIAAFGREAMMILTGKKRITKWRGSVLPCTLVPGFKVYPVFHPSYVNRLINEPEERLLGEKKKQQQNALPLFLIDLGRVKEQSDFPEIRYPTRTLDVGLSFHELIAKLKELASLETGVVSVDIETLVGEEGPLVWMIGFSLSPEHAFIVPILEEMRFAWSLVEEAELWRLISKVFLNPNLRKVFHNGLYDLSVLGRYYGLRVSEATFADTMLCHHASYPYLRKGLDLCTSIYTWEPYYKDEGKVHGGKRSSDRAEAVYNGKDCCVTREILPVTERNARELGTYEGYQRTLSVIPSLLGMMIRGVRINVERKDELAEDFRARAKRHHEEFERLVKMETNLNSHVQVRKVLYGLLGLPIQYDHKTKKPTTGKDAIKKLRKKARGEEAQILDHYSGFKRFHKLASTYAEMEVDSDGRIHTSYSFVSTWRLNSRKSFFGGGGNLQNIPAHGEESKAIRSLFIPDEGMEMGAADYDRAEAWVTAFEANDLELISQLQAGEDIHWLLAQEAFQIPSKVPYNPEAFFTSPVTGEEAVLYDYRQIARSLRYAGNYGMGPVMLQTALARAGFYFDFATCKKFILWFKRSNPFVMNWQREIREKIKATRTLISAIGRKRQFMGRLNDNLYRAGYAFSPQNTVGEMMELTIQGIHSSLAYVDPLLNNHDEVVYQNEPKDRLRVAKEIKGIAEMELEINRKVVKIPVDFKAGPDWGHLKGFKI